MTNRRKVLIGIGSVGSGVALGGCSGEDSESNEEGSSEEDSNEESSSEQDEPDPANFQIQEVSPRGYINYHPENPPQEDYFAVIENIGDEEDTQIIEFQLEEVSSKKEELNLDGGQVRQAKFSRNLDGGEDKLYQSSYHTEDDERIGGDIFVFECPSEEESPDFETIGAEDLTNENVKRFNFDIRLSDDTDNYTDNDLILIAKRAVCVATKEENWNAIGITLWEEGQNPGYEQAYGECNWAPYGKWSLAGNIETGDYSKHEYAVTRF